MMENCKLSKSRSTKKHIILEKIVETNKKYNLIQNGDRIVLGVSGGPDSICMLDALIRIKLDCKKNNRNKEKLSGEKKVCQKDPSLMAQFDIVVAHVNHMIRAEASDDEKFVKEYCEKNNIDFYSKSIDVKKLANNNKIGTEEARKVGKI